MSFRQLFYFPAAGHPLRKFLFVLGDEVVLGSGVQLHPGGTGTSAAVHHWLVSASTRGVQHSVPLLSDHRCPDTQHFAHCTHLVSKMSLKDAIFVDFFAVASQPLCL